MEEEEEEEEEEEYWFRSLAVLRSMNAERLFHRSVYLDKIRVGGENVLQKNESNLKCMQIYCTEMYRVRCCFV
jgi:hypothetical protein